MGPELPPGLEVLLPGRGRTWVYDSGPPPGRPPGPPLLLLHGWTSTAALNFHVCFPALTARYRVVALDHRGHGRGLRSHQPFRLEDCADDAAALVEHLDLGSCTVVGYSMGGPIAQLLWRRHPGQVAHLVLCATAAHFPVRRLPGPFSSLGAAAVAYLSFVPSRLRRRSMDLATARWTARHSAATWASVEWGRHDPAALIQAGAALARFDSTSWISLIDVPTAVVVTKRDMTVSPRRQTFLADNIPRATRFEVHGDHRVVVDGPGRFLPALLSACDEVRSRKAPVPTPPR